MKTIQLTPLESILISTMITEVINNGNPSTDIRNTMDSILTKLHCTPVESPLPEPPRHFILPLKGFSKLPLSQRVNEVLRILSLHNCDIINIDHSGESRNMAGNTGYFLDCTIHFSANFLKVEDILKEFPKLMG